MLKETKKMEGFSLRARDGTIGEVKDFYFDDYHWHVRYLVVSTGHWLKDRKVLISPEVVDAPDWHLRLFPVDLTMDQVRGSPDIDAAKPVSWQHEVQLQRHYGWPAYWDADSGIAVPVNEPTIPKFSEGEQPGAIANDNLHLRSANDTKGYRIEAIDGLIGHVEDFLIGPETWRIWYLAVDTRNWWPGKKVLISPAWVTSVSWSESQVGIDLSRDSIKTGPEYDSEKQWSPDYAAQLHAHYGRPFDPRSHLSPTPATAGEKNSDRAK